MIWMQNFKETEIGKIPEDWETKLVSEAISINPKRELKKGSSAKYVSMADIAPYTKKVTTYIARKFSSGSKFQNGDTLLARITPCLENGKTVFVDILKTNEVGWGSTEFVVLSGKEGITDSQFVYYIARSPYFRNIAIQSMSGTSGRQRVQEDVLGYAEVLIPPLHEQRAIAKILSDLDAKIELSRQMNQTLEQIGQALFKRWFVDFEFPNENGKPYKSSGGEMVDTELGVIPKVWDVKSLKSVLSLLKDGSHNPPKRVEQGIKFIAGASDVKHFSVNFDGCTFVTKEFYDEFHRKWQIQSDDILYTIVGTVGNIAIVRKEDLPFSMQRSIALLRSNEEINQFYLYFLMNDRIFSDQIKSKINPTAQPGIYLGEIGRTLIIVPSREILLNFSNSVGPLVRKMQENINQIQSLSSIRNSLLPKLMSGEIRVKIPEERVG
jgi:type I restriction enzyme, S subunit